MRTKRKNCQYCNEVAPPFSCKCYNKAVQHTPTPWEYVKTKSGYIVGTDKLIIARINPRPDNDVRSDLNAAFIVRAVNCHEEFLEVAERVLEALEDHDPESLNIMDKAIINILKRATAKAKGK